MNSFVKIFIGLILLAGPLVLYANEYINGGGLAAFNGTGLLGSLWTVIKGSVPPFLALIGLFIVWLELDELRIERELKKEEDRMEEEDEEEKPRKKKK